MRTEVIFRGTANIALFRLGEQDQKNAQAPLKLSLLDSIEPVRN